jgi:hypothetical protein
MVETFLKYSIVLTYRCNGSCKYCNRFLDIVPWNVDLSIEDLKAGWKAICETDSTIVKVRITGGEPLMHPNFDECINYINQTWNSKATIRLVVMSNQILPRRPLRKLRYRGFTSQEQKIAAHEPPMISPKDLGLSPIYGTDIICSGQRGCGRLFDPYGFSYCVYSGPIGRVLGIDPYQTYPVLQGQQEMCEHCTYSLDRKVAVKLFQQVRDGKLEYPTKSYKEGVARIKDGVNVDFPKFQERLKGGAKLC